MATKYAVAQVNVQGVGSFLLAGKLLANGQLQGVRASHQRVTPVRVFREFDSLAEMKAASKASSDFAEFRAQLPE